MPRVLKDPLVHFLLLGLGLFALFAWVTRNADAIDDKVIEVDRDALLSFVQYHARAFSPEAAAAYLDGLDESEFEKLVDRYVREEVLYREALALGMDRSDHVIKHRLVESVEFITDDLAARSTVLTDADIETYFQANKERYYIESTVTFTHVFYNADNHGADRARSLAEKKLAELNQEQVPFAQAPGHGDRFLYLVNYVDRIADLVASHFGDAMAKALFEFEPDDDNWVGPIESHYGQHLVLLVAKAEGRFPELGEVVGRVRVDAERDAGQARKDAAIDGLLDTYEVRRSLLADDKPDPVQ